MAGERSSPYPQPIADKHSHRKGTKANTSSCFCPFLRVRSAQAPLFDTHRRHLLRKLPTPRRLSSLPRRKPQPPSPPAVTPFATRHHFLRIVRPFARHPRATSAGAHHYPLSVGVARHPSSWARHPSAHARKANGAAKQLSTHARKANGTAKQLSAHARKAKGAA